jgi:hypothetical protein
MPRKCCKSGRSNGKRLGFFILLFFSNISPSFFFQLKTTRIKMSQQEDSQDSQELLDEKEECESSPAKKKQSVGTQMDESEDDDDKRFSISAKNKREEEEARKKGEKDPLLLTASKGEANDCPSNCGNCPICLESVGTFYLERANDFKKKIDLKESGKLTCAEKFAVESNPDFEARSDCPDGECRQCNTCLEKEHEELLKKEKENLLKQQQEEEEEENLSPRERDLNILLSIAKSLAK